MANNPNTPLLNPIISLLKNPSPKTVPGGGKSRASIVQSRVKEQKNKLSKEVIGIKNNIEKVVSHAGHIHVIARMFSDSTAPSWTPNDIFTPTTNTRIIAPSYDGYLVEASLKSLDYLAEKIENAKTVNELVDISRLESISIFSQDDTLRNKEVNLAWNLGVENKSNQFNLWLLPFHDMEARDSVISCLISLYENEILNLGYPEFDFSNEAKSTIKTNVKNKVIGPALINAIRKYKKDGNASFTAVVNTKEDFIKIVGSGAVYRIEPVSPMKTNETPPGTGPEPSPSKIKGEGLPTVVIIDGGCSAKSYLPLNILNIKPLVSDHDADLSHGNQVTSLVCHGYAWNNNLSLPELDCNFISAQAINKLGVTKQPTSDQFISYLRQVAAQTKDISSVWNLSFNEIAPSLNPSEISFLGHEISKLAREFDILPVISIGNVTKHNAKRLCPPADSEAALTISGRIADSKGFPLSPCPYSLKGPAPAGMKKPELSWFSDLRMIGGIKKTGTSFSAPLVSSIAAHTFKNLKNPTPDLVRALLINKGGCLEHDSNLGWGSPWEGESLPWLCKEGTVTLTWSSKLKAGYAFYWNDIPLPSEMFEDGKLCGQISLTAILKPVTSELAGENYFSTRLECALQSLEKNGNDVKIKNILGTMRESKDKESSSRKDLAKWSPIRHHSKKFSQTIIKNRSLRLYARVYARDLYQYNMSSHHELDELDVSFVLTFKSNDEKSGIYNSMTQQLGVFVESAVINQDIEIRL